MRNLPVLPLLLIAAFPTARLTAADAKWIHATSAHFDMYTAESEGDAKAALQHLEATRTYFLSATKFHDPGGNPVRIVAFKTEGDFAKYKPQLVKTGKAFSIPGAASPATIVTVGLKPDIYEQIVREYAQLVLDDSAPTLPYWFRAGLATVYSTLKPGDAGMDIGAAPRSSFRNGQVGDVELPLLFTVNRDALMASREKSATDFYAGGSSTGENNGLQATANSRDPNGSAANALQGVQSALSQSQDFARSAWMLVHMTMFQQDYRTKFGAFMRALAAGGETGAVFNAVYGAPVSKVAIDLNTYAKRTGILVMTAPFKADKAPAEIKPASKEDQERILADLAKK